MRAAEGVLTASAMEMAALFWQKQAVSMETGKQLHS